MESAVSRALRFAVLGGVVGVAAGAGFSLPLAVAGVGGLLWMMLGLGLMGFVAGFAVALVGREGVGGVVAFLVEGPRGKTRPGYSYAQALAARGAYAEAVAEYASAADTDPSDPEPLILGARILLAEIRDPDQAAEWLHRAATIETLAPDAEATVVRELVELYDGPLGQPRRALPLLARMAQRHQGTRPGEWAARRLARLRTHAWEGVRDDTDQTRSHYNRQVTGTEGDPQARA